MPGLPTPIRRKCGAMEVHHRLLEEYAPFRSAQADLEKRTRDRRSRQVAFRAAAPTPINIPLVVHVVWNSAAENISDAQINSQIDALNRDYSAANADKSNTPPCWSGLVTAADVQFHLARTDANGNPTSGITRTQTTDATPWTRRSHGRSRRLQASAYWLMRRFRSACSFERRTWSAQASEMNCQSSTHHPEKIPAYVRVVTCLMTLCIRPFRGV